MKNLIIVTLCCFSVSVYSQVKLDNKIELTGAGSAAKIEGIQDVTNPNDAASKTYVDNAVLQDGTDAGNLPYWDGATWRVDGTGYDYQGSEIGLNDNQLRIRGALDGNHFLQYDGFNDGSGPLDGPELVGLSSVRLRQISGGSVGYLTLRNNRVGINTANPTKGLLEVNGQYGFDAGGFWFYANGTCCAGASGSVDASIHATNRIQASEFNAFSDARIKNIIGVSNGSDDLNKLMGIEITNYNKIDAAYNKGAEKKVIAQQLEEIYPQAVSKITDVIPNIYKLAQISNGRIEVANELEAGSKVRLLMEDRTVLVEVVDADAYGFSVDLPDEGQVFVYGEEVDDFRIVDYEAISMLNVSATQEMYRLILALQQKTLEIDEMRSEVDYLKELLGTEAQAGK